MSTGTVTCPECGTSVPTHSRFCPQCGHVMSAAEADLTSPESGAPTTMVPPGPPPEPEAQVIPPPPSYSSQPMQQYATPPQEVPQIPQPGQAGYPVPVYPPAPMGYQPGGGFQCPYCHSTNPPYIRERVSQTGWILLIVLLFVCLPLFWIGLLQKETYRVCSNCGMPLG